MADNKDLEEVAKNATEDFYELLGVAFDATEADIKRAYRKTSLQLHPDKNPNNLDAADRFIRLGIAKDILLDTTLKSQYDTQRLRRKERALQDELLTGKRRQMKEDLERREREGFGGVKRKRGADLSDAEKRELEIQRLAEDGKRRRHAAQEALERQRAEEEASFISLSSPQPSAPAAPPSVSISTSNAQTNGDQVPEIERTVRIRYASTPTTSLWTKDTLSTLFAPYGKISSIVLGKPKKAPRASGEKHRRTTTTTFIIYARLHSAYNCVSDAAADHPALDSVSWAAKEPDLTAAPGARSPAPASTSTSTSTMPQPPFTPSTPRDKIFRGSFNSSLASGMGGGGAGPQSVPSTPQFSFSPKTPSLEEVTMMRLKQAEKRKLEAKIRAEEAAEDAAGV
ncbi:DnaJ-domain-containing protein [Lophiostoma macrostomum CBS 122681]|uniref:DnaJ-domain-containing protein n=1 Tax=Lophiostoma macrostomum CBS 122681 TaxID=1314788 RepID=A0A6A6TFY2_9PLEO|nr:DnaJ-domain-containing protein [Lophiostoma macrostomum CBS 122681]